MQKSGLKTKISLNPNSKGKFRQTPRHSLRSSQPGKMLDALKSGDSRFAYYFVARIKIKYSRYRDEFWIDPFLRPF